MPNDYSKPVYVFKGREYKSLAGFHAALMRDAGSLAEWVGAIRDGVVMVGLGRNCDQRIVARYSVSKPEIGKPMTVARV